MRRKAYRELLAWKEREQGASALLVQGARRVGKSYLVEEFAKAEYDSYILIDFNKAGGETRALFEHDLEDLDTFFLKLSALYGTRLVPRRSLIVLDEVQLFPRARAAIKYLVADGRFDYIETGSLMSIKKNVEGILLPSEEDSLEMFPMDFEEFCWAMGNEELIPLAQSCFEARRPMGQALHRKAMDLFRQYLLVGGMPQAVESYVGERDFERLDRVKRRIIKLYRDDIRNMPGRRPCVSRPYSTRSPRSSRTRTGISSLHPSSGEPHLASTATRCFGSRTRWSSTTVTTQPSRASGSTLTASARRSSATWRTRVCS